MAAPTDSRQKRRILLLTSPERGQSTVFLATAHSLLDLGAEVHFASFPSLRKDVEEILPGAVFHELQGPDMKQLWETTGTDEWSETKFSPPSFWNMAIYIQLCLFSLFPWSGTQFVEIYHSVMKTLVKVDPDMIVTDAAFSPALTACNASGYRFTILSPNSIKDFAVYFQPALDVLFQYPNLQSGLPYPIPWYLMPLNAWYVVLTIILRVFDIRRLRAERLIEAETGAAKVLWIYNLVVPPAPSYKILVSTLPELEFPFKVLPSHIVPCGPMIAPAPPTSIAEADLNLAEWLDRRPTLYINMGTLIQTSLEGVNTFFTAIQHAFEAVARQRNSGGRVKRLQVLWKLNRVGSNPEEDPAVRAILGDELAKDTVRVVGWLKPHPSAVLAHRNIVAFVNHGGANSFLEGVVAGKPQVVIPAWIDCFDFANRVELLGSGVWANKRTAFGLEAADLAAALEEVLLGPRAQAMKVRAEELAAICRKNPGRVVAAKTILAETDAQMEQT